MPEKRVLLLEDEWDVRELLAHVLRAEGYAATVDEAWRHLNTQTYALVIADWRLPDGDGILIADAATQLGVETLVMSGYLFRMPRGRAEQHDTLMKPIRPTEIIDAARRKIGKARSNAGT